MVTSMKRIFAGVAALALFTLAACSTDDGATATPEAETITDEVELVDAPSLEDAANEYAQARDEATTVEELTSAVTTWGVPACAESLNGVVTAFAGSSGPLTDGPYSTKVVSVDQTSETTGIVSLDEDGHLDDYYFELGDQGWQFTCQGLFDE